MTTFRLSGAAITDLDGILGHLQTNARPGIADRYQKDFDDLFAQLIQFPGAGTPRPRLGKMIHIRVIDPYSIFYQWIPADDAVKIVRIIHGSRRLTRKMLKAGHDS